MLNWFLFGFDRNARVTTWKTKRHCERRNLEFARRPISDCATGIFNSPLLDKAQNKKALESHLFKACKKSVFHKVKESLEHWPENSQLSLSFVEMKSDWTPPETNKLGCCLIWRHAFRTKNISKIKEVTKRVLSKIMLIKTVSNPIYTLLSITKPIV